MRSAARHGTPVRCFERPGSGDLASRDDTAARELAGLAASGGGPLLVLVGELRVCPAGLLARLERSLPRARVAALYLDLEEPWMTALEHGTEPFAAVDLGKDRFCVVSQSPLSKYLGALAWSAGDEPISVSRLEAAFASYAGRIARTFNLPFAPASRPRLFQPGDTRFLLAAADHPLHPLSSADVEFLAGRIRSGESRFLPDQGLAYFGDVAQSHVAEEASHWVRSLLGGPGYCHTTREDAFFGIAVQESAGFAGSRVIAPARQMPTLPPPPSREGKPARDSEELAHLVGYSVGNMLFDAFRRRRPAAALVKDVFTADLVGPGAAKALYFRTLAALKEA
jgi:hypothetical protein